MKVLRRCPITLDRLKQNDTAKLLKSLTRSENQTLVELSKEVRAKWKSDVFPTDSNEPSKRKLKDTSNSDRDGEQLSNGSSKKLKTKDENVSLNSLNNKHKKTDKAVSSSDKNIKTVKCKLGKSRSIGVLERTGDKPASSSNSTPVDHKPGTVLSKGAMLFNNTASTPSPKLNVSNKVNGSTGIQIIEAQPLPITELVASNASSQQTKHIIKESAGFMDALSSIPAPKMKKKKKIEKAPTEKPLTAKPDLKASPELDKMEFDSGVDDLNTSIIVSRRLSSSDKNNSVESESSESEFLSFDTQTPYDPDKQPSRGILLLMAKGKKRRITWPGDEKLEKVKYFESDENERCNVSKSINSTSFVEHRKEEMEKERDLIKSKNTLKTINNPGTTFIPYRLHLIDFEGVERFPVGLQSEEKKIQEERLKTVLEDINLLYTRPDPRDPEPEMNIDLMPDTETKEIPLEDENNMTIADYSQTPFKVSNDPTVLYHTPTPVADNNQAYSNMNGLMNGPMIGNQMNNYLMNANQFSNINYGQMMGNTPNLYGNQQPMYNSNMYSAMPMVGQPPIQPMPIDSNWTTSNWNSVTNQQQQQNGNFHNNGNNHNTKSNNSNTGSNSHNKKNHQNKKGKKVPCRFYLKPGGCQKGSSCPFLH